MVEPDPRWYETFFDEHWLAFGANIPEEFTLKQVDFLLDKLALSPGASVLDVACGSGRHAIELARRGYAVTGADISEPSLELARKRAAEAGVSVRWMKCDMRAMPFDAEFAAAINMFTAFGYFDTEAEDQRGMDAIARALHPGGGFLIEIGNSVAIFRRFQPQGVTRLEDGTLIVEERAYDTARGRIDSTWTWLYADGRRAEKHVSHRAYTPAELVAIMERAGLAFEAAWGGLDGAPVGLDTPRLIALARKPG